MEDYDKILETLHLQLKAELEKAEQLRRQNDLAEQALAELQRNRQAQQQRMRLAFDTNDKVSGLWPMLQKVFQDIREINHLLAEAERRAERTDDILLLLLTEKSPQKVQEAMDDLEAEMAERETDRRKLLRVHLRNLAQLREQAAAHGSLLPLSLLNEIQAEEQAIEELKQKRPKVSRETE